MPRRFGRLQSGPRCAICLKPLTDPSSYYEVVLEDVGHGHVQVGADCFLRVVKAGADGVKSGQGLGAQVFSTTDQALRWCMRKGLKQAIAAEAAAPIMASITVTDYKAGHAVGFREGRHIQAGGVAAQGMPADWSDGYYDGFRAGREALYAGRPAEELEDDE